MQHLINIKHFHQPLQDAGLVPPHCRLLEIEIGVSGALTVRYEVYWDANQLIAFADICRRIGQQQQGTPTERPEESAA